MAVRRRAKVLLIDLSTEYTLVIHLKMTGQMVYVREAHKLTADSRQLIDDERFGAGHPSDSLIGQTCPINQRGLRLTFTDARNLYL